MLVRLDPSAAATLPPTTPPSSRGATGCVVDATADAIWDLPVIGSVDAPPPR
ncbi:MAG: hypothetical protein R2690_21100 [Acidimicrobiales bacterium]